MLKCKLLSDLSYYNRVKSGHCSKKHCIWRVSVDHYWYMKWLTGGNNGQLSHQHDITSSTSCHTDSFTSSNGQSPAKSVQKLANVLYIRFSIWLHLFAGLYLTSVSWLSLVREWVSEQFLNGTSAYIRLFSAIHSFSAVPHVILTALQVLTASHQQNRYKNWPRYYICLSVFMFYLRGE